VLEVMLRLARLERKLASAVRETSSAVGLWAGLAGKADGSGGEAAAAALASMSCWTRKWVRSMRSRRAFGLVSSVTGGSASVAGCSCDWYHVEVMLLASTAEVEKSSSMMEASPSAKSRGRPLLRG
jgi:hypothetical protein